MDTAGVGLLKHDTTLGGRLNTFSGKRHLWDVYITIMAPVYMQTNTHWGQKIEQYKRVCSITMSNKQVDV